MQLSVMGNMGCKREKTTLKRSFFSGTKGRCLSSDKVNFPFPTVREFVILCIFFTPFKPGFILIMKVFFSRVQIYSEVKVLRFIFLAAVCAADRITKNSAVSAYGRNPIQKPVYGLICFRLNYTFHYKDSISYTMDEIYSFSFEK